MANMVAINSPDSHLTLELERFSDPGIRRTYPPEVSSDSFKRRNEADYPTLFRRGGTARLAILRVPSALYHIRMII